MAASLPFLSLSVERAARKIIKAVVNEESLRILGLPAQIVATIQANFPRLAIQGLSLIYGLLPKVDGCAQTHEAPTSGRNLKTSEPVSLRVLKGLGHSAVQSYQT